MIERSKSGLLPGIDAITDRAALHEDDRMMSILSRHGCGQAEHKLCSGLACDRFKADGQQVVALINDEMPIIGDEIRDGASPDQTLPSGDIDVAGRLPPAAVDHPERLLR